jgi:hypothetical protein
MALLILPVALVLSSLLTPSLRAQSVTLRDLSTDYVRTPDYQPRSVPGARRTRQWLQLSLEYASDAPDGEWIDVLTLEWYVLASNGGRTLYLTTTVTYLDVEDGRHDAVAYVHPAVVKRYAEGRRFAEADLQVFVRALVNGREEHTLHFPEQTPQFRWWETPPDDAVQRPGGLLNRLETPFAPLDDDAFEYIRARY